MPAAVDLKLSDADFAGLAAASLGSYEVVVFGVSGGSDSMALLVLAKCWLEQQPHPRPVIHVATVDHGLRAEAANEAVAVATAADRLGLPHHTLKWQGDKPATGLQAAAREARYRLLAGLAGALAGERPAAVVTAHHLEDQAETFLMRLARGSGVDGLSAMAGTRALAVEGNASIDLVRPFLAMPKARLRASLEGRGITWIEDPSNADPSFERVRIRRMLPDLEAAGIDAASITTSAVRLARARDALESLTTTLAHQAVETHGGAFAGIDTATFDPAPMELRLRVLQRIWRAFGSPGQQPRLSQLEIIAGTLDHRHPWVTTLGGARLERTADRITVMREPGRLGLPVVSVPRNDTVVWDGRFRVTRAWDEAGPLVIRALPAEIVTRMSAERRKRGEPPIALPRQALLTLPSLWRGDAFLGGLHPALSDGTLLPASAQFIGLRSP